MYRGLTVLEKNAVNSTFNQVKDTMPGYPLRQLWHGRGRGKLPDGTRRKTVHDFIDEEMARPEPPGSMMPELERMRLRMRDGYRRFNEEYGEEAAFDFRILFDRADTWLQGVN